MGKQPARYIYYNTFTAMAWSCEDDTFAIGFERARWPPVGRTRCVFRMSPAPATVTRVLFTPADLQGRAYIRQLMEAAGLAYRVDAAGNLFGRWIGSESNLPAVATGSHCDAIPHSGRYDGTVGVIGD